MVGWITAIYIHRSVWALLIPVRVDHLDLDKAFLWPPGLFCIATFVAPGLLRIREVTFPLYTKCPKISSLTQKRAI